jgi:SNF2 family DNA or RNA helicase
MKFEASVPQQLLSFHLRENNEAAGFVGCGLGKTAVVLHNLAETFDQGDSKGALVVAPLRVCNLTWPAEVRKWDSVKNLRVANLRTSEGRQKLKDGSADIYLINYDQLQQFREQYLAGRRSLAFDTVVWDELTRAKNHKSKRVNAVRPYFRRHCKRHWGITGTPTPNGLLDLFAQIRLLDGGERLGPAFSEFRKCYFEPVDYDERQWTPKTGSRERIYKRMGDFALTLKSSDWLDIPDVIEEDVELALAPEARTQYEELERELLLLLNDERDAIVASNAAVLVNKLLQVASGAVYDAEKRWHPIHEGKVKAFSRLVKSLGKRPVLVAYQYQHELTRIMKAHPEAVAFNSAKTEAQQMELIRRWNAGKIPMLVAHPKSMAHGLNMQDGGSVAIWFTLPWSREDYDQFNARLARRGQDQITEIYRLVTRNTADEIVAESLRSKDEEQTALLDALRIWKDSLL